MNETVVNKELKKDRQRQYCRRCRERLKYEVLRHYSPELKCQKCGFNDFRALSVDHIQGGGLRHFRQIGSSGSTFYSWLRKRGYPTGYQVLCMNCQWVKRAERKESRKRL